MNIYIIPAWYPQNDEDITACFFREQAHALADCGHQVTVIHITPLSCTYALRGRWHQTRFWQDGNVRTFFHQLVIPIPGKFTSLQDWYISKCYKQIIQAQILVDRRQGLNVPDLIHAHVSHSCAYYCLDAARRLNLPLVVTEHYSGLLLGTVSSADYNRVKKTILESNAFVFVGSNFQKTICQKLGIAKETFVIPNMVDTTPFLNLPEHTSHDTFTFLTACHLKANKSIDLIIQAFHSAFANNPKMRLLICGDGEERASLEHLVVDLKEQERIRFHGKYSRAEVPQLFSQTDVFVLTSKIETFGIVYVEAMMCGLPCIGTVGQGAEDIIDDSNGIKVPYGDIEVLKTAMRQMAEHPRNYDSEEIRQKCISRFSAGNVCSSIEKIYQMVAKQQ